MKRKHLLFPAVLALVLAACASTGSAADLDGAWQLQSGTYDGDPVPILDSHPITLTIDGHDISGTAACNGYGGEISLDGGLFTIVGVSITEMACSPQQAMASESLYTTALFNVESAGVKGNNLVLTGPRGTELVFSQLEPVPTADLLRTVWVLDGLISGDAVTSVSGERATLELFSDGSFIGSTGCRTITGDYIVSGAEVAFTSWGAHGECPAELADQDSRVISALEGGFRVDIDGDRMTTWVAGDEGLTFRAER